MFANAVNMYRNNDLNGLKNLAQNIAEQKGINLNELQQKLQAYFR